MVSEFRASDELQLTDPGTPYVYGHPIAPCAMADAKGNVSVVMVSFALILFVQFSKN